MTTTLASVPRPKTVSSAAAWPTTARSLPASSAMARFPAATRRGASNIDGTLPADLREYGPEVLWNFEAGVKARAADGRLSFRGSLFHMQRDDVQIDSSIVIFQEDGSTEFIDFVGNAAQGTNSGAEVDVEFTPTDAVSLYARVGLLRSEYEDYTNGEGIDLGGRGQAHAPGYQFSVGADFAFGEGYFAQVEMDGRDEFYFSDSHSEKSTPYTLLNASAGYRGRGLVRDGLGAQSRRRGLLRARLFFRQRPARRLYGP